MLLTDFENIIWPEYFEVHFSDDSVQVFDSSNGIQWNDGSDNIGEDENRSYISCSWKKKSPSQQSYKNIDFFVDEIQSIKSLNGGIIWQRV